MIERWRVYGTGVDGGGSADVLQPLQGGESGGGGGVIRQAAGDGAQVILLPELFETWYFCQERNYDSYQLAMTVWENPAVCRLRQVAAQLKVVLPVSFFERAGNVTYNSVAVIDADGELKGVYRKTHIPDDHFYQEKFYFTPGNTGFQVWDTAYGKIGLGICWDRWFRRRPGAWP